MPRKTKAQLAAEAEALVTEPVSDEETILVVNFRKLSAEAVVPSKQTEGAVGLDLSLIATTTLFPRRQNAYKLPLGIAVEIPEGYHAKVFLRSSVGLNTGLRLANGTGIIDSDYRGELSLIVENTGLFPVTVAKGERLAQLILEKNVDFIINEVDELSETERSSKGFGSTGK